MSLQYPGKDHHQVLYQADPNAATTLKSIRDRVQHICSQYVGRLVRVQTLDGNTYEGVIAQCDSGHIYLSVANPSAHRAFFGPSPFFWA